MKPLCTRRIALQLRTHHQRPILAARAETDQQQQQQQQNLTRRIAVPAAASVLIAAAGFVFLRKTLQDLAGPEAKKATLKALSAPEEAREGQVRLRLTKPASHTWF